MKHDQVSGLCRVVYINGTFAYEFQAFCFTYTSLVVSVAVIFGACY